MKKEKLNWYILIGCLALTGLFAILTIVYMIKSFSVFSMIALMVDIFAIGVIIYCFLQEKQEEQAQAKIETIEEDFAEEFDQPEEEVSVDETEMAEEALAEESNDEVAEYEKAPDEESEEN